MKFQSEKHNKKMQSGEASSLVSAQSEDLVTSAEKDIHFRMEQITFYKRIRKQMGFNGIMCSMNRSQ